MNLANEQTFEFGEAKLKAKDSLRFTMRESGNGVWYLVEDEISGRFFQIGLPQYTFLSMLDGRRTVNQVLMKTASLLRQHSVDEQEAANICKWAIESGLVETELASSSSRRAEQAEQEAIRKSAQWLNPITLKFPLMNPDGIVTRIERFAGWLVSWGGLILWLIVVGFGFTQLAQHWDSFLANRVRCTSSVDLVWLAITWIVLKLIHETSHSVVCKRFAGRVHSCGVLLLLLIPLPYVDVTSSWRFENKWHRILTAAAGMLSEIFLAAIACCVWVWSDPGPIQYHAGNVIIAATLTTLIFNANPLMRFDGYYMLQDWLEIPNLYTHGRQYVKRLFKKIYFGGEMTPVTEVGFRALFVKVFGMMTIAWFMLIAVGLLLGALSLLEGIGLLVALVAVLLWVGLPIFKLLKYTVVGTATEKPNRLRFATAMSLTVALAGGVLIFCPSPSIVSAPIVVDYEPMSVVRAKAAGFVKSINIENGQWVEDDQILFELDNPELVAELESLVIDIKISKLRCDTLLTTGDIASLKLEQESLAGMEARRVELTKLVGYLEVRAPQRGKVLARDLMATSGKYFSPGDELLSIGNSSDISVIALARQEDVDWIESTGQSQVDICVWGHRDNEWIKGDIQKINPRARDDLPHEAFAATNGGPLTVVPREQVEDVEDDADSLMLTDPRVQIEIAMNREDQQMLMAGQTGAMFIRSRDLYLGKYLAQNIMRFLRKNTYRSHGL